MSRTAARAVLKLMLPTLREALRRSLPPELGEFFASLRGPFRAEGSFDVRAAPPLAVASASLDGASSEAEAGAKARRLDAARRPAFAEGRNVISAAAARRRSPSDGLAR